MPLVLPFHIIIIIIIINIITIIRIIIIILICYAPTPVDWMMCFHLITLIIVNKLFCVTHFWLCMHPSPLKWTLSKGHVYNSNRYCHIIISFPEWFQLYSSCFLIIQHDDVIKWNNFPRYCPFVRGTHWSLVNSPHKDQWRGALMFSLIYASNHQPHDCLLNRSFRRFFTDLFPAQRASNAENVSIWWRHHDLNQSCTGVVLLSLITTSVLFHNNDYNYTIMFMSMAIPFKPMA